MGRSLLGSRYKRPVLHWAWTTLTQHLATEKTRHSPFRPCLKAVPQHLRTLARVGRELELALDGPVTQRAVLDALEAAFPVLRGTIRDHSTKQRRAFIRFFACGEDLSHEPPDAPLPEAVASGAEPFLVVGAMAGG